MFSAESTVRIISSLDLSLYGRNYSGMPIIPAANIASAARNIKLGGHAVKAICSSDQQIAK
jgi:hypothetical protein